MEKITSFMVEQILEGLLKTSERVSFLLPVDRMKYYTEIRGSRAGEWSAVGEMKETKDKVILTWIKKYKKQVALWSVVILIAVPLSVYSLSEISLLPVTGGNDWAGFWGGYIGAIIGGLITLFVMKYTVESENAKSKRQEKIQYFNDVIKISAEFFEVIGNLTMKMTRCMTTPINEKYEQVLEESNRGARISIILEIMLKTREKEYNLNLYTDEIIRISSAVKGTPLSVSSSLLIRTNSAQFLATISNCSACRYI